MDIVLIYILSSVAIISLVSLVGILFFVVRDSLFKKIIPWLVAFAAGSLLGASLFDLLPESFELLGSRTAGVYIVIGIILFLLFEQVLHWHHQHRENCSDCDNKKSVVGYSVLLGDSLHNFLDGILIASAFLVDMSLGVAVAVVVLIHEVPQELGDFAVLIHSGFSKRKALLWNLFSSLFAVLGGVLGYFYLQNVEGVLGYIIAIGAGGFLYIALVDLLAEFKHNKSVLMRTTQIVALLLGLIVLFIITNNKI